MINNNNNNNSKSQNMERLSTFARNNHDQGWRSKGIVSTLIALAFILHTWWPPSRRPWPLADESTLFPAVTIPKAEKDPPPKSLFVFLAGLEGTGHHLYKQLYIDKSTKLRDIFKDGETRLKENLLRLQTSLYNDAVPEQALFTGALAFKKKQNTHPDGDQLFASVVQQLNETNRMVLHWLDTQRLNNSHNKSPYPGTFPIPLNAVFARPPFGMMSYPNYLVPSRPLQYPDLHLLYRACDAANVSCGHVYLHRDPYEIIESTVTKRHFGQEDDQIVLYTTMMGVLRAQLIDHSDRSIGCLDFDHLVEGHDLKVFLDLLGIKEKDFRNTYNPPQAQDKPAVSPYLQIYMDTFVDTSEAVWETCTRSMALSKYGWLS